MAGSLDGKKAHCDKGFADTSGGFAAGRDGTSSTKTAGLHPFSADGPSVPMAPCNMLKINNNIIGQFWR
jgi:hypothetical protein